MGSTVGRRRSAITLEEIFRITQRPVQPHVDNGTRWFEAQHADNLDTGNGDLGSRLLVVQIAGSFALGITGLLSIVARVAIQGYPEWLWSVDHRHGLFDGTSECSFAVGSQI
jgi:hypothetical protein